MQYDLELSIIIPAYNEESILSPSIKRISATLNEAKILHEIIIVDDGSKDSTILVAKTLVLENNTVTLICSEKNRGKGSAIKTGFSYAKGKYVCFIDADLTIHPSNIIHFFNTISRKGDIIIASRHKYNNYHSYAVSPMRSLSSITFKHLRRFIVGILDVKDTQCGCKMLHRSFAEELIKKSIIDGFCFDVELLLLAKKKNMSIFEYPVEINEEARTSYNFNLGKQSLYMTRDLCKIRINDWKRKYE